MNKLLKNCPHLTKLFRQYLADEITGLVKDECRIFICFGNDAARYFNKTLYSDLNVQCQTVGTFGKSNMVRRCIINGEDVFVVSERHYAYYAKASTNYLVGVLSEGYGNRIATLLLEKRVLHLTHLTTRFTSI